MNLRSLFLSVLFPLALAVSTAVYFSSPVYALTWTQVNTDGFGEVNNQSVGAMAIYNSKLYAGTSNNLGAEVWEYDGVDWTKVNTDGFGNSEINSIYSLTVHDGKLYAGTDEEEDVSGTEVWEYDGVAWTQVGVDGFGTGTETERVYALASFNGKLYAGTDIATVWEYDGVDWTQISAGELGTAGVLSLSAHGSKLYAGTLNVATGAEVWEYDGVNWAQVNTDGFGDVNNTILQSLTSFSTYLYAGTYNPTTGAEVWKYDGSTWTQINDDGFGDLNNARINTMAGPGEILYVGVDDIDSGTGEVWEYDGVDWTQASGAEFADAGVLEFSVLGENLYAGVSNGAVGAQVWTAVIPIPPPPPPPSDTTPPSEPVLTDLGTLDFNSGFTNWYYTDPTPVFQGTGEVGSTVFITINSDSITGSVAVGSDGKWSYTSSAIPTGKHTVSIYTKDSSGNKSSTLSFNLTIDPTGALFPQSIRDRIFGSPVEAEEEEPVPAEGEEGEEEIPGQEPGMEAPEGPKPSAKKNIYIPWLLGLGAAGLLALAAFLSKKK